MVFWYHIVTSIVFNEFPLFFHVITAAAEWVDEVSDSEDEGEGKHSLIISVMNFNRNHVELTFVWRFHMERNAQKNDRRA